MNTFCTFQRSLYKRKHNNRIQVKFFTREVGEIILSGDLRTSFTWCSKAHMAQNPATLPAKNKTTKEKLITLSKRQKVNRYFFLLFWDKICHRSMTLKMLGACAMNIETQYLYPLSQTSSIQGIICLAHSYRE